MGTPNEELSDDRFLAAFLDLTLDPRQFDHRGHLRIAWIHLQRYPLEDAVVGVCDGIRAYAAHLGAATKYNRTVTEALVRIMHASGASDAGIDFASFLARNPDLIADTRAVLRRHYSDERLFGAEAAAQFVPPDRTPLPCVPT